MEPLSGKQKKVLNFIEHRLRENNPPSQREIAEHFGLAQNAVCQLIGYLKKKGYITDSGGHRGLRLSQTYQNKLKRTEGIPIVGRVAAGEPILAEENIDGYIRPDELVERVDDTFILKVVGDSMVDDGIMHGDYIVVKPTSDIRNGQIAVVLLDDEATVKKVFLRRNRIALKPANKSAGYKTRYIGAREKNIRIIGRVTACIRRL
jgi:repressor LexA